MAVGYTKGETVPAAVYIYDATTSHILGVLPSIPSEISSLRLGPGGDTVAVGLADSRLQLYRLRDGALLADFSEETGDDWAEAGRGVTAISFSPDGRRIFYGRDDAAVTSIRTPFWTPLVSAQSLTLSPIQPGTGQPFVLTVRLNRTFTSPQIVELRINRESIGLPRQVTIPAGQRQAEVRSSIPPTMPPGTRVSISATIGGTSTRTAFTVAP